MERKISYRFLLQILTRSIKKFYRQIFIILLGVVINILSLLFMPQLLSRTLYGTISEIVSINELLLLASVIIFVQITSFFSATQRKNIRIELNCQMKTELVDKIFAVGSRQDLPNSGKLLSILSSDVNVVSDILFASEQLVINIIQSLVCLYLMFIINYKMTIIFIFINCLFLVLNNLFRAKIFQMNKQALIASDNILSLTKNIVNDLPELIISGAGNNIKAFYRNMVFGAKGIIMKCEDIMLQASYLTAISRLAILFIFLLLANQQIGATSFYGESFIRYMVYVQYASTSFQKIITLPSSIASYKVKVDRIADLYSASLKWNNINSKGHTLLDRIDSITINNLQCMIGSRMVLKDVSLTINNKKIVAITGLNGAGKTTLMRCICRQIVPSSGRIYINNVALEDIKILSLLEKMSIMSGNVFFENMSILENMALFSSQVLNTEKVTFICRELNINKDIEALPEGLNTIVSKEHIQLSKGQIQRICIARCLLKEADIYIFDEPTSHTDNFFNKNFFGLIERLLPQKSVVILTHDKKILHMVPSYYELLNGEIVMRENI